MDVLILLGSRNPNGQTAAAIEALCRGAESSGAKCEVVLLPTLNIERCRQCNDDGWGLCREEGRCVIEDDLSALIDKVRKADAVVAATPVYFGDLSESLRACLDRLRRTTVHTDGSAGVDGKPVVGICVAGGGGGGAPSCCLSLERVLITCGFDVVDLVPARRQNLAAKKAVFEAVGRELAAVCASNS